MIDLQKTFNSEDGLQVGSMSMISQNFPEFRGKVWHVENEGTFGIVITESLLKAFPRKLNEKDNAYKVRVSSILGNKAKAKGKLAGVPDILILYKGILYKIELKLPDGVVSTDQILLHNNWNKDCYFIPVVVCRSLEEVYNYCKWILEQDYIIIQKPSFFSLLKVLPQLTLDIFNKLFNFLIKY